MRNRLMHRLSKPALLVVLFFLSLALFNWPLLSAAESDSLQHSHFVLFSTWAILVVALWAITTAIRARIPSQDDSSDNKGQE